MSKSKLKKTLMLLLTAAIWGFAFVAQSVGMDYIGPFTFNCVRSIIGGLVLIPCIFLLNYLEVKRKRGKEKSYAEDEKKITRVTKESRRNLIFGGICCGVVLFLASCGQQIGIQYTTVGKAGFITALYIVMVPLLGIFLKKKTTVKMWSAVAISLVGFYFLSIKEGFELEVADIYLLVSSFLFSIHIMVIDYFAPKTDGVTMACIQFLVCGVFSGIVMLLVEKPKLSDVLKAWIPILYAGVLSSGVAYTLQILGQKNYNPTIASLILSLESVFSVLAGWVILKQKLSGRELLGCVLIFTAIILAQLSDDKKKSSTV